MGRATLAGGHASSRTGSNNGGKNGATNVKLGLQLGYWGAQAPTNHAELVATAEEAGFDRETLKARASFV